MSAEGQIYVEKHSPYTGTTFTVHLRLGLLSNDANDYRIWAGDEYLAEKCRCSIRAVSRAKSQLVKDGYLEVLFAAIGRRVAEYRFIFKGQEIGRQSDVLSRIGRQPNTNRSPNATITPIYRNELKESETLSNSVPMPSGFKNVFKIRT